MSFLVIWLIPMLIGAAIIAYMMAYDLKNGHSYTVTLQDVMLVFLFVVVPIVNIIGCLLLIGFILSDMGPNVTLFTIKKKE